MPVWEDEAEGPQLFYENQLRHYGILNDEKRKQQYEERQAAVEELKRKTRELNAAILDEVTGMPRPPKVPRKLVRGSEPFHPTTKPPDAPRLIFPGPDGRYDPSKIQVKKPRDPTLIPSRPVSSDSFASGTPGSKTTWRSRRDSVEGAARRLSSSLREKADIISMAPRERLSYLREKRTLLSSPSAPAHVSTSSSPTTETFHTAMSKGELLAMQLSKKLDPVKKLHRGGQRNSLESAMSIGMTDRAPDEEVLEACARCYRPTTEYLIQGLCLACHEETRGKGKGKGKGGKRGSDHIDSPFVDPWRLQERHTSPSSPESGMTKLPNRRMRRIRRTMYQDPGNPFAEELEAERVSPRTIVDDGQIRVCPSSERPVEKSKSADAREPMKPVSSPAITDAGTHEDVRDSGFYELYEELLRDYETGQNEMV